MDTRSATSSGSTSAASVRPLYLYEEPGTTHNGETIARYGQRVLADRAATVDEVLLASSTHQRDAGRGRSGEPRGARRGAGGVAVARERVGMCAPPAEQLEAEALARAPRRSARGCAARSRAAATRPRTSATSTSACARTPASSPTSATGRAATAPCGKGHLVRRIRRPHRREALQVHLARLQLCRDAVRPPQGPPAEAPVQGAGRVGRRHGRTHGRVGGRPVAAAAAAVGASARSDAHGDGDRVMMQQAPPAGSSTLPVIQRRAAAPRCRGRPGQRPHRHLNACRAPV